jgi:hypothetical protein
MNGVSETVAALSGAGTVTNNASGTSTLNLNNTTGSTTFSGILQDGSGTGIIIPKTWG